jgi:hypothetical protein
MLSADQTAQPTDANGRGSERTAKVRELNDAFRRKLPRTAKGYRLNVTAGVAALGDTQVAQLLVSVKSFANFSPENDPYGEHDFGAIEQDGVRYFFKIDSYDQWMQFGSPDPADPAVTTRVLTIMRADEY